MNQSDFRPFDGPQPIYVSVHFSVLLPEQHSPSVVVYDDGQMLYDKLFKENGNVFGRHYEAVLSKPELAIIYGLMEPIQRLQNLGKYYKLTRTLSHVPAPKIYLHSKNRTTVTQIEGFYRFLKPEELAYSKEDASVIEAYFKLYYYLEHLEPVQGKPRTPKYFKLLFRREDRPRLRSMFSPSPPRKSRKIVSWPKEWPTLDSPQVSRQKNGYTLFLDATQWAKLRPVPPISDDSLIRIQGKIYEVLQDEVYPREPEWYEAFGIVE